MSIQAKIVKEIVGEEKEGRGVVAINVLGSVAKGEEREDSDVDIQIVSEEIDKWSLNNYERYGVKIDFEIYPKDKLMERSEKYPYLCYVFLEVKSVFDPSGFMDKFLRDVQEYFDRNPKVVDFWKNKEKEKKELKENGCSEGFSVKCYDEAELLFSREKKVTRDFFLGKDVRISLNK